MADFPSHPEAITPAWLSERLRAAGVLDGDVTAIRWEPIGTGQVGDSARFHLEFDHPGAGPATIAGKFPAADLTSRGTAGAFGLYTREVGFYRDLAPHLGVRVPQVLSSEIADDGIDFHLLFEDLGPARGGNQLASCSAADARAGVRQAAAIHAPGWGNAALTGLDWLQPKPGQTDQLKALYGNAQTIFRERYAGSLEPEFMGLCEALNEARDQWFAREGGPTCVVHGDFRLDNMLFEIKGGAEEIAVLDWQTVAVGNPMTDIGYFLGTGIGDRLRRAHEGELLDLYCAQMTARGVPLSRDAIWDDYVLGALHGISTAVFSSAYVERTERGDANFLSMARGGCALALQHGSLAKLRGYEFMNLPRWGRCRAKQGGGGWGHNASLATPSLSDPPAAGHLPHRGRILIEEPNMLTKGDDYPLHQTPEPVAYAGTDRNFYDRYFFNGYAPDGSGFFAAAFGIYPHLNVADAHFSAIRDGVQHNLHASRELGMERMDLAVGPIRIEILEPLHKLRVIVDGEGLKADLTFTGRAFPIEEPRFIHRIGPRTFMDYTRMTQNGHYTGWIEIDGVRQEVAAGTSGTRDRSWGVRPVGTRDEQPHGSGVVPGFFWQWTPLNFADRSVFFHVNADARGNNWNTRAVIAPDGADAAGLIDSEGEMASPLAAGTRWPERGTLVIEGPDGPETLTFEPLGRFQMRGLGYVSPKWGHGLHHGPLAIEREDFGLAQCDPGSIDNFHVQIPCRVVSDRHGTGIGVFEQLILGPYAPMGLGGFMDLG